MNQSICPLPFAPPSENGVVEGPSLLPPAEEGSQKKFRDLLDSELEDEATDTKKPNEAEPWTILGHAQPIIQVLQLVPPVTVQSGGSSLAEPAGAIPSSLALEKGSEVPKDIQLEDVRVESDAKPSLSSVLQTLKPAQQNLPVQNPPEPPKLEQIAGNWVEPAKKANGIPAAQEPLMLFASQKEEESALRQSIALSEVGTETGFEPEIQVRTNSLSREPAPRRDLDIVDSVPTNAVAPEWSSFEGISDIAEVQAPRDIESIEVAQAIRTHVELLKTTSQEKIDVVLRPDGQTELRLHVEKVNGQILVQARCDRGDFARLEANWSAIQQSLATQGMRVEALQNGATLQNESQHWNNSSNSSNHQFGSREENKSRFIEQEFPVPNRPKQSVASKGSARGWQSWA